MEFTCGIDDEAIELEAMNRLQDRSIKLHLTNCDRCQRRVFGDRNIDADQLRRLKSRVKVAHFATRKKMNKHGDSFQFGTLF